MKLQIKMEALKKFPKNRKTYTVRELVTMKPSKLLALVQFDIKKIERGSKYYQVVMSQWITVHSSSNEDSVCMVCAAGALIMLSCSTEISKERLALGTGEDIYISPAFNPINEESSEEEIDLHLQGRIMRAVNEFRAGSFRNGFYELQAARKLIKVEALDTSNLDSIDCPFMSYSDNRSGWHIIFSKFIKDIKAIGL